jgi:hypothetical protein
MPPVNRPAPAGPIRNIGDSLCFLVIAPSDPLIFHLGWTIRPGIYFIIYGIR